MYSQFSISPFVFISLFLLWCRWDQFCSDWDKWYLDIIVFDLSLVFLYFAISTHLSPGQDLINRIIFFSSSFVDVTPQDKNIIIIVIIDPYWIYPEKNLFKEGLFRWLFILIRKPIIFPPLGLTFQEYMLVSQELIISHLFQETFWEKCCP